MQSSLIEFPSGSNLLSHSSVVLIARDNEYFSVLMNTLWNAHESVQIAHVID